MTQQLVIEAERLGYERYWFAEHHNTNGLLSAAPELFIARMGAVTSRIKLGSGGVLLPQYRPLKIAETFSTLAAFYPNRIELGIGNSPGGSERTRRALTDGADNEAAAFPRLLDEVNGFLTDSLSSRHPYRIVKTTPRITDELPLSVLGLSPRSAKLAAERDIVSCLVTSSIPTAGKRRYRLTATNSSPSTGDNQMSSSASLSSVPRRSKRRSDWRGHRMPGYKESVLVIHVPSFATTDTKRWNAEQQQRIEHDRRRTIVGTPEQVARNYGNWQSGIKPISFC